MDRHNCFNVVIVQRANPVLNAVCLGRSIRIRNLERYADKVRR